MSFPRTSLILVLLAGCSDPGQTEIARGNVLASQKKYADALAAYQAAAAAQPRKAHPQELAGHLLFDLGRSAEARIAYQEAVQREPQDALEAKIGLARLDAEDQRFDDALARLNGILEKNPQNLYALLSRATVALRRGKPGEVEVALVDTAKAMAIDSNGAAVLYTRGSAFIAAKEYEQAQTAFGLLEHAHPKSPLAFYGYARVASATGDLAAATVNLPQAPSRSPDMTACWNS